MKLAVGTNKYREGWTNLNLQKKYESDIAADVRNMPIEDDSVEVVYISHVLEHFKYAGSLGVHCVLKEINRILSPGGKIQVGVPDMEVLADLYLRTSGHDRVLIMRIMMGGQIDKHDVHYTAFDEQLLRSFLHHAGFENITRVKDFGVFDDDCSVMKINGTPISLNMEATKCIT